MVTTMHDTDVQSGHPKPATSVGIGPVIVVSLGSGLVVAVVLVVGPFLPAVENLLIGGMLLGFALGWALLGVLSARFTNQPQRWAAVPSVFFAVAGLAASGGSAEAVLAWLWPPALGGLVVWVFLRGRGAWRARITRWLLYPILATLALAAIGGSYETVRESLDAKAYPPPGQLVDVGGHRLHLNCTGSGRPTVVLEPGLGATSSDLGWITPAIARDSRVCVYDRAGRGWSDTADGPQDAAHIAADLHTLLERAHEPGPYVLAGHSFGGLYVQSFAAQFPDQVAGLVLLDSTAPKPGTAVPTDPESASVVERAAALVPAVAHLGVGRLIAQSSYASLPARARDEARANSSTARSLASFTDEFLAGNTSTRQASDLTDLHGKPLIVLTADTGHDAAWTSAQDQLARVSTNSLHRVAHATHASLIDDEADSAAASRAIRDVVASVRAARPLAQL